MASVVVAVFVVTCVVTGLAWLDRRSQPPDRVEVVGPFELTGRGSGAGGYTIRHRGEDVSVEGRAGMFGQDTARYRAFNAAITFPSSVPAIVVNVGDPNNTSFFYLVREHGLEVRTDLVGEASGGTVSADWIDLPPERASALRNTTVHRARLDRGRWLLLGDFSVLDVETFAARALMRPDGAWVVPFRPPITLSPGGTSFVRLASGSGPDNEPVLACFDLESGAADLVRIDPQAMRYRDLDDIDASWVAYHFEWVRDGRGHEHPLPRADLTPRPWRGRLLIDRHSGRRTYEVKPASEDMAEALVDFIEREFGGARLPRRDHYGWSTDVKVADTILAVTAGDRGARVRLDKGASSRIVAEIGARFDEVLASGAHDALFDRARCPARPAARPPLAARPSPGTPDAVRVRRQRASVAPFGSRRAAAAMICRCAS